MSKRKHRHMSEKKMCRRLKRAKKVKRIFACAEQCRCCSDRLARAAVKAGLKDPAPRTTAAP